MKQTEYSQHQPLLQWAIGMSLLLFVAFIAWQQDIFHQVIEADRSRISLFIMCAFVLVNIQVVRLVVAVSRERNATESMRQLLDQNPAFDLCVTHEQLHCCGNVVADSVVARHLQNLVHRLGNGSSNADSGQLQTHLLSALDKRLRGQHKYGWLLADLMIKLGLIGTVIGFIFMLGSVATIEDYDISTMQELLRNMSGGMQIALYTTLTGLCSGLLLGIQYQFLDRQADELLADIEELSEVYVLPYLLGNKRDQGEAHAAR